MDYMDKIRMAVAIKYILICTIVPLVIFFPQVCVIFYVFVIEPIKTFLDKHKNI